VPTVATDILALGEALVEYNQTGAGDGRHYLQGFGGDTSNTAIAAARQGARVGYLSAVGDDAHGALLRDLWASEGVDGAHVRVDPRFPTGIYFVTHDAGGHRFSYLRAGSAASRMRPDELPRQAIESAKVLHLSGISAAISETACDACFAAVEIARSAGVRVSFDTNLRLQLWPLARARAVMQELIAQSDLCLPSYDDVRVLFGLDAADALVDRCRELGARAVALKLGREGAIVDDGARRIRIEPHPCNAVDATGAGDVFGGSLLACLVEGQDLESAARYATVAAALSTEGFGAVAPIPRRVRVLAALGERRR
jgi:2-dehydro-3-deoxygluconokinase